MKLNRELQHLLYEKHSLENALGNILDISPEDSFDVIFNYKIKISTMKELIPIYKKLLDFYKECPEYLIGMFGTEPKE